MAPSVCASCNHPLPAGARFCPECGSSQPRACSSCGEALPATAKFCPSCGGRVGEPPPATSALPADDDFQPSTPLEPQLPAELAERIRSVRSELTGERREVAVLFADLSGFTAMSEKLDAEDLGLLVNRLLQDLSEPVYRYEGYVDKYIGDAVMALFGAPLAHENDSERAVLAALGMLEVLARHNATADVKLALRIGINLGEVIATHLGGGERLQYTVIGDTVNVASRLEGKAEPNTVLVSEALYLRVAHRFNADELPPLQVKGKREPLKTFRIAGVRSVPGGSGRPHEPFVGRQAQLELLARLLERAAAGSGGTLVLEAEPGTGKSRLAREALERREDDRLLVELAFSPVRLPGQRSPAADLFLQLVPDEPPGRDVGERAAAALGVAAPSHAAGVQDLAAEADPSLEPRQAPPGADPAAARQNRWAALAALLRVAAAQRPVVLLVEDLHWMDDGARELLAFLLGTVKEQRIAAILTARPGTWVPADAERVELPPLETGAARELLERLLGANPSGEQLELMRRAEGNPLFLLELARALQQRGPAAGALPGTLHGLLVSRIDALPPEPRLLLQMGAVLGLRFPTRLLSAMYALQQPGVPFDVAMRRLEADSFLLPDLNGEVLHRFHHALVQEAAYGGLLVRMRRVLHESAARIGEEVYAARKESEAAFFAHHFWEAGLPAEAAPHLWSAGRAAADRHDLQAAERFLDRYASVAEAADGPGLGDAAGEALFQETYGLVLLHRGKLDSAAERFRRLEELGRTGDHAEWMARGLEHQGRVAWYAGRLEDAQELFETGLAQLPEDAGHVAADLHNDLGVALYYRADVERAFAEHRRALALREALADRLGTAKSLTNLGNLLFDFRDDLEAAEDHYRRALHLAQDVQDRQMVCGSIVNLAGVARDRGEWRQAIELYRRGREMQEETGWSFLGWLILRSQAECELWLGAIEDALHHLGQVVEQGDAVLEPFNRVALRLLAFEGRLRSLDDAGAEASLAEARDLARSLAVKEKEHEIRIGEGRLLAARGDWGAAAERFVEAERAAGELNHPHFAGLARIHRRRAEARLGGTVTEPLEDGKTSRPPMRQVLRYLAADAAASTEPTHAVAETLAEIAAAAGSLGNVALERAASEREWQVRTELGDADLAAVARERARAAAVQLGSRLPSALRDGFVRHPHNAGLGLSSGRAEGAAGAARGR